MATGRDFSSPFARHFTTLQIRNNYPISSGERRRILPRTDGLLEDRKLIYPVAFKIPDAVSYSGLSRSRVYELIQSGTLASFRVGGRRLILRETVDRFIHQAAGDSR